MSMKRIDINQHDVFVSWTGADRELKDQIVEYLRKNEISCLESDHQCSGDFRQWSREAVGVCNIFLPIVSSATFQSKFVPVEVEEYKKLENYENRIVPVWTGKEVFDAEPWNIKEYGSSVILDENGLTEAALKDILNKVISLIINLLDVKYKQASKSEYIKLISLSRISKNISRDFDFSKLYINRTLCETDENGNKKEEYKSTDFLYESKDISFIYGPAGCGKSQYINQIRENAPKDVVIISIPCSKIVSSDVFSAAFKEFNRVCGNRYYYTESDFISLINSRRMMLVFDGMDEIATVEDKRKLISKAEDFYKSNKENATLVFTGRNIADADLLAIDGKNIRRFLLEKLSEDEIRTLSENLFICFDRKNEFGTFFVKISDLNEEIRSNPLLLSQLAIIYYDKKYVPESIVGIYDAISEISLNLNGQSDIAFPEKYKKMLTEEISGILKDFSKERYLLLSNGKNVEPQKIFSRILKSRKYGDDIQKRSEFLVDYLESRAIFVDGEFYHKMFLEYFTAVKYYESAFGDYDEIEDVAAIEELFSCYADPYWSAVIKMFLVKADCCIDKNTTKSLYELITNLGICEYTILFDTCRDLLNFKEYAQKALVSDIIRKSAEGVYPAYGPLFWYVPEYGLYEACLVALEDLQNEPHFAKMLALIRDVCFIMGGKYTAKSFTDKVSSAKLFASAQEQLSGIRKALCELFYLGETDFSGGVDVYPRCFNVSEAKSFMKNGCGVIGRMSTPFSDELDLFSHTAYNELNDEFIGFVACPYIIDEIENKLTKKSCRKLTGLILSVSQNTKMEYIAINRRHIKVVYLPENIEVLDYSYDDDAWNINMPLSLGITAFNEDLLYFSSNFYLPDSIKTIPSYTFYDNPVLEDIYLPATVEVIGEYAFKGCNSLKSVNIPESITEISEGVFFECSSLTSIDIPERLTKIGNRAFKGCEMLTLVNIHDRVTEIGWEAFSDCRSLTSIEIPESVSIIGYKAFKGCEMLTLVNIPDKVTEIGWAAFFGCSSLETIKIPESVTKIGGSTFSNCSSLKTIEIPKSVTVISDNAFENCNRLTAINIPNEVTGIGYGAFNGCFSLTSVNIPDSIIEIEDLAFNGCSELISVEISIRFKDDIERIFGKVKPDIIRFRPLSDVSLYSKDKDAKEENVVIPYGTTKIKALEFNCKKNIRTLTLPETIKEIGWAAFFGCSSLESIEISEGVTKIKYCAFEECCSLKSIKIPESVTKIGSSVFSGCSSLESIEIPEGVTEIQSDTFRECSSLKSIKIPESVTKIGDKAFDGCSLLTLLYIPYRVTEIGWGAFSNCSSLKTINIPDGVKEIEGNLFSGCSSLASVNIPCGVTRIGEFAFDSCSLLKSIEIPKSVTTIGGFAFNGCSSLKEIKIPDGVTLIGLNTFEDCRSLTSICIPDGVMKIDEFAFNGCTLLKAVDLSDGITKIGNSAFENCSSLTSVEIPSSVRIIGDDAFKGCTNLTSVKIGRQFEDDISRIFGDINRNIITFIN